MIAGSDPIHLPGTPNMRLERAGLRPADQPRAPLAGTYKGIFHS